MKIYTLTLLALLLLVTSCILGNDEEEGGTTNTGDLNKDLIGTWESVKAAHHTYIGVFLLDLREGSVFTNYTYGMASTESGYAVDTEDKIEGTWRVVNDTLYLHVETCSSYDVPNDGGWQQRACDVAYTESDLALPVFLEGDIWYSDPEHSHYSSQWREPRKFNQLPLVH